MGIEEFAGLWVTGGVMAVDKDTEGRLAVLVRRGDLPDIEAVEVERLVEARCLYVGQTGGDGSRGARVEDSNVIGLGRLVSVEVVGRREPVEPADHVGTGKVEEASLLVEPHVLASRKLGDLLATVVVDAHHGTADAKRVVDKGARTSEELVADGGEQHGKCKKANELGHDLW